MSHNLHFFYSETAAQRFGIHIAYLQDGQSIIYTAVSSSPDFFNNTYQFEDRQVAGSFYKEDLIHYEHISVEQLHEFIAEQKKKEDKVITQVSNNIDEKSHLTNPLHIIEQLNIIRKENEQVNQKIVSQSHVLNNDNNKELNKLKILGK